MHIKSLEQQVKNGEKPFKDIVAILQAHRTSWPPTLLQAASTVLALHSFAPYRASAAYNTFLLFARFNQLRFEPSLRNVKKLWNTSSAKYVTSYNFKHILQKWAATPVPAFEEAIRGRLVMVLRIMHLMRSIDVSRTRRSAAEFRDQWFVPVMRKGAKVHSLEQLIDLEPLSVSPQGLFFLYCAMTCEFKGKELIVSLKAPRKAVSADTIGSITRHQLRAEGVEHFFSPHSTKMAAVATFHEAEVTALDLARVGRIQNLDGFGKHYMQLNSTKAIQKAIVNLVVLPRSTSSSSCSAPVQQVATPPPPTSTVTPWTRTTKEFHGRGVEGEVGGGGVLFPPGPSPEHIDIDNELDKDFEAAWQLIMADTSTSSRSRSPSS
jgi:hypothetical protein